MPIPSSVRFTRNGVEYLNNVAHVNYTIEELTRAALKDTGKYICRITKKKIKKRTGRLAKNIQYWVKKRDCSLEVGFKPGGFYGGFQELGTSKVPKVGALSTSVEDNIDEIRKIQAQYLTSLNSETEAMSLIDESEEIGSEE